MFCAHEVAHCFAITDVRPFHSGRPIFTILAGQEITVSACEKDTDDRTQRALWGHGRAVMGGDAACTLERWGQDQRACLPQCLPTGSDQIVMGSAAA